VLLSEVYIITKMGGKYGEVHVLYSCVVYSLDFGSDKSKVWQCFGVRSGTSKANGIVEATTHNIKNVHIVPAVPGCNYNQLAFLRKAKTAQLLGTNCSM